MQDTSPLNSGSRWHRWDPHTHSPGTIFNDQFGGAESWGDYLSKIECATPVIKAIGITDYYGTAGYQRVCSEKRGGRLPQCELIFPNIEMRLAYATVREKWANLHLLVSPEDQNHLEEINRFLSRLSFQAFDDQFSCTTDDLIRLGKKVAPNITDPKAALARGAEQFKVDFAQLTRLYRDSRWAKENILIAVAGGQTDGTSGIRSAADVTLRQEVEKFAHIIFASSVQQREFWLGQRALDEAAIRERYGGLKPCMHGSDAHGLDSVGEPDGDRYSWVKGLPAFDTLRQACIEPKGRAFVGPEPPMNAVPSRVIDGIEIGEAPWAMTPSLALNPGLVAIIGARGSGKTALADIIALACDSTSGRLSESSFLTRASDLLENSSVSLRWHTGEVVQRYLNGNNEEAAADFPRARYLSQRFVDELCSADGMTDELLREIERVIFVAHPEASRDGTLDFDELLNLRATRFRIARARGEDSIVAISDRIGMEKDKVKVVPLLRKQIAEKTKQIEAYNADRAKLIKPGSEARVQQLGTVTAAAETVRSYLRYFSNQEQSLLALQDEVSNVRTHQAPETLRRTQERYKPANLTPDDWQRFLLDYSGDVDASLNEHLATSRRETLKWRGTVPSLASDINVSLIPSNTDLKLIPLSILQAEIARLEKLVNVDRETAAKFSALSQRITEENAALERLKITLADCEGAQARAEALFAEREEAYKQVFESIVSEQQVLTELYSPLMARLRGSEGTLKKLSFSVERTVDVAAWAEQGESLFDLRHKGKFRGRGSLEQAGQETLANAWTTGDAAAVSAAMIAFRRQHQDDLLESSLVPKSNMEDYRDWSKQFAKWLYSTRHIALNYSIDYDGIDIRKLSPGTRGIILLLLYLALDNADDRPLIIDQPEENLDPKSIFDELVALFLAAKQKRQVIMITHNANLVVNTNADQVIVANAGIHVRGELPPMTYISGGLESADIRKAVCDILEGGERAFQERARRLRVHLER